MTQQQTNTPMKRLIAHMMAVAATRTSEIEADDALWRDKMAQPDALTRFKREERNYEERTTAHEIVAQMTPKLVGETFKLIRKAMDVLDTTTYYGRGYSRGLEVVYAALYEALMPPRGDVAPGLEAALRTLDDGVTREAAVREDIREKEARKFERATANFVPQDIAAAKARATVQATRARILARKPAHGQTEIGLLGAGGRQGDGPDPTCEAFVESYLQAMRKHAEANPDQREVLIRGAEASARMQLAANCSTVQMFTNLAKSWWQGQEVVSQQGGAGKRGIGGIQLLVLLFIARLGAAAAAAGVPYQFVAGNGWTAAGSTFSIVTATGPQSFPAGWYDVSFDMMFPGSGGATTIMCELCLNDEPPLLAIPARGLMAGSSCASTLVTRIATAGLNVDRSYTKQMYIDPIYDIVVACTIGAAQTLDGTTVVQLVPLNRPAVSLDGWKRDLTREGVEPNPGPKRSNRSGGGKFKAWLAEHPAWHGKPEAEALEVYRAAKEAQKAAKKGPAAPEPSRVREAVHEARSATKERKRPVDLIDNPYTRCVVDPFHAPPARVPDHAGAATALFQLKQTFAVQADTNGRACVFLRPGVGQAIAYSGAMSDASIPWSSSPGVEASAADLPRMVWAARSTAGLDQYWNDTNQEQILPPLNAEEAYCAQEFINFDKTFEMVGLFGSTRTVAAAVSLRNIANKFEQQGRIVGVPWDGDLGVPGFGNATLNIGRTDPQTGLAVGPVGVTFANLVNLENSIQAKGADGMTIHAVKTGDDAITDFRQTAPTPTYENPVTNAIWHLEPNVAVSEPIPFSPAVCNSAVTQRFVDMVAGLNPAVSTTGICRTTAPANALPVAWMDSVPTTTTDYSSTSLYGAKLQESIVAAADNSTANVLILRRQLDRLLHSHATSAMSPGDCGLIVLIEGLKPTTKVADGATGRYLIDEVAEPFEVEVTVVFEAIPRTGTVKIGQESKARMMPVKAELAAPIVRRAAMEAIGAIPIGHPGAHETEMDARGRTSTAAPVADWFKGAFNTVEGWVKDATGFLQKNPWLSEAAEALFAFMV